MFSRLSHSNKKNVRNAHPWFSFTLFQKTANRSFYHVRTLSWGKQEGAQYNFAVKRHTSTFSYWTVTISQTQFLGLTFLLMFSPPLSDDFRKAKKEFIRYASYHTPTVRHAVTFFVIHDVKLLTIYLVRHCLNYDHYQENQTEEIKVPGTIDLWLIRSDITTNVGWLRRPVYSDCSRVW